MRTAEYPSKCGIVKNAAGCAVSTASFSPRSATRTARIGPPGGVCSPNRLRPALLNGRSHAKGLPTTSHVRLPCRSASVTSGSSMAIRAASSMVATLVPYCAGPCGPGTPTSRGAGPGRRGYPGGMACPAEGPGLVVRAARPGGFDTSIAVIDDWWGRPASRNLTRLFLDLFCDPSLIAEHDGELAGFVIGFLSPSQPEAAYVHFTGVGPAWRRAGLARRLYEQFFERAHQDGR